MVTVKNLSKYFFLKKNSWFEKPAIIKAVDNIFLSIRKGQTLGLVGESGSGKTTVARSILRLIKPDTGEIDISGTRVDTLKRKELQSFRKKMQIVFQDPDSSLNPRMTVEKIISEPLKIHTKLKKNEISDMTNNLIEMVGLQNKQKTSYPHEFSGGEKQRIGIARALALNPSFIILDEPISALDVSIQGQILNLLMELQETRDLTYLFVSHDLAAVEHISTRIAVMYAGKIVEENASEELYNSPLHPYTQSLLNSIPEIGSTERGFKILPGEIPSPEKLPGGCHFHPRCKFAMDICQKEFPQKNTKNDARVYCHLYNNS